MYVVCFSNYVLEMSDGMENMGSVNWKLALCLLLAWIIIFVCLIRGIRSLGKVRCSIISFKHFFLFHQTIVVVNKNVYTVTILLRIVCVRNRII